MNIRHLSLLALVALTAGCRSEKPQQHTSESREPTSIQTAYLDDVVPLVNGGAYAVGNDYIWYLKGQTAVRVRALGDSASRAEFASAFSLDVQPTVDGGAYALSLTGGIWRLEADSALPVREAASIPADTTIPRRASDSLGWLLYARERRERAAAEGEDVDEEESPYDPAEEMP